MTKDQHAPPKERVDRRKDDSAVAQYVGPPKTVEEATAIVLAEFVYWREASELSADVAIGACGAAANIFAALKGWRAAWHPKPKAGAAQKKNGLQP